MPLATRLPLAPLVHTIHLIIDPCFLSSSYRIESLRCIYVFVHADEWQVAIAGGSGEAGDSRGYREVLRSYSGLRREVHNPAAGTASYWPGPWL